MFKNIPLSDLVKPKVDARTAIDEDKFNELVKSIKEKGVIEPIIVRDLGEEKYEVVVGSRRVLAAATANLGKIPAIIRKYDDETVEGIRLDENIVREDMNQVDIARYIEKLMQTYHLTQEAVAKRIGRTTAYVSQMLNLLRKDPVIRDMVENGEIDYTTGRELLRIPNDETRRRLARYAQRSGANASTVRNWANRELSDMNRKAAEFKPPEETEELKPLEPAPVTHPCRACGRVGPLDGMVLIRVCPDCGNAIEAAIEKGAFYVEPEERESEPEPEPDIISESTTPPSDNIEINGNTGTGEGSDSGV